jgi:DNA-binding transcriptional LysR family regulator
METLGQQRRSEVVPAFDLRSLSMFVTVVEYGSFTRAAAALEVTTACVSLTIKRLERALGAQLLRRDAHGLVLTQDGDRLLPAARRMLALNAELMREWPAATGRSVAAVAA